MRVSAGTIVILTVISDEVHLDVVISIKRLLLRVVRFAQGARILSCGGIYDF